MFISKSTLLCYEGRMTQEITGHLWGCNSLQQGLLSNLFTTCVLVSLLELSLLISPVSSPSFVFPPHFIALCSQDIGASLEFSTFSSHGLPLSMCLGDQRCLQLMTLINVIHSLQPLNWRGQKEVWFLWSRFKGKFHHVWVYLYSQLLSIGDYRNRN